MHNLEPKKLNEFQVKKLNEIILNIHHLRENYLHFQQFGGYANPNWNTQRRPQYEIESEVRRIF